MKKWTKAEREKASQEGKARWAARKLRDTRQFQVSSGDNRSGGGAANASGGPAPISAADENMALAAQLGKEQAWRKTVAVQLIGLAYELLSV